MPRSIPARAPFVAALGLLGLVLPLAAPASAATTPMPGSARPGVAARTTAGSAALAADRHGRAALLPDGSAIPAPGKTARDAARAFVQRRGRQLGLDAAAMPVQREAKVGTTDVVRLGQTYHGLPVVDASYIVRLDTKAGQRVVSGTSGDYFTGLRVATEPKVSPAQAERLAVAASADPRATARSAGLVVLPVGSGTLAYKVRVTGHDHQQHLPLVEDTYIEATVGTAVRHDNQVLAGGNVDIYGTRINGSSVRIHTWQDAYLAPYKFRDTTRTARIPGFEHRTYDLAGADQNTSLPPEQVASSPDRWADGDLTKHGAVDAHWGSDQVLSWYKRTLDRDGVDGKGAALESYVDATEAGTPLQNAYYIGNRVVYGTGDRQSTHSFAAALDVVGHEITHGVTANTANLIYQGQSGALNEAFSDYFGNAIENDVTGRTTGTIMEDVCNTPAGACSLRLRQLDEVRTVKTYQSVDWDNQGVHINSTIPGSAMWAVRKTVPGADQIMYRALAAHLTPRSDFLALRAAVIDSARELGHSEDDVAKINQAFDERGIAPGWERQLIPSNEAEVLYPFGVDEQQYVEVTPVAAAGRWVAATKTFSLDGATSIVTGTFAAPAAGSGRALTVTSPAHALTTSPTVSVQAVATDGRTVAWAGYDQATNTSNIYSVADASVSNPTITVTRLTGAFTYFLQVSGGRLAWSDPMDGQLYVAWPGGTPRALTTGTGRVQQVSLRGSRLVWTTFQPGSETTKDYQELSSLDLTTMSRRTALARLGAWDPVTILQNDTHVVTLTGDPNQQNNDGMVHEIARYYRDLTGKTVLGSVNLLSVPNGARPADLYGTRLTLGAAGTYVASNAGQPKIQQMSIAYAGAPAHRFACTVGAQSRPSAAGTAAMPSAAVWMDYSGHQLRLVGRAKAPAGELGTTCAE